jgi:hypothetical protein
MLRIMRCCDYVYKVGKALDGIVYGAMGLDVY